MNWDMHNRTTPKQARANNERNNGKNTGVENPPTLYDDYDKRVIVEGSRVVHVFTRSNKRSGRTS